MLTITKARSALPRRSAARRTLAAAALAVAAAAVTIVPAATAHPSSAAQPQSKKATAKPFVVNQALAPATLDPAEASNADDGGFISNFYVTLTQHGTKKNKAGHTVDDYTKIVPYLAKSWKIGDGGKTYTFTLRKAVFPDGSPMDAAAVKYSFDRLMARNGTGNYFLNAQFGKGFVTAVEAPNPTTVIIRLRDRSTFVRYEDLHTYVDLAIVNPRIVEQNGGITTTVNTWMASHVAGGGPYLLESYDPNSGATLVANPKFFGPKPLEKKIRVNFIRSDPTLLFQASAGKADVTVGLTKQSAASLRGNSCCKVAANGFPNYISLALPNLMPPFDNATFRQALTYAVPYQAIIKNVLYGYADNYYGLLAPEFPNYNAKLNKPRALNIAKAKQMIQQSGVKLPANLDVIVREGENDLAQIATVIKSTWAPLGVNVNIKVLAASQYLSARGTPKRNYGIFTRYQLAFGDPAWILGGDLLCGLFIVNNSDYCNPKLDTLFNQMLGLDQAKRQGHWNQLEAIWKADAPRIPLYEDQYVAVLSKKVKKFHFGTVPLHMWTWSR
jgi:peptide/nickel transport system substrate-binding protein